jgi:hypothetical protein
VVAPAASAQRVQTTQLISRAADGGMPNGQSTHAVISNDRRYARIIAFESDASNLVANDRNGHTDVFAIRRAGPVNNRGTAWQPGRTFLVSRTYNGAPSNGPSFAPAVDGSFKTAAKCVAFLSRASNLVRRDTNGRVDAFLVSRLGRKPRRLLLPGRRQPRQDVTHVAVSGNCSRIAFVAGGRLYVQYRGRTRRLRAGGAAADPSFSTGKRQDLVFGAGRGVYLSSNGTGRPRLVAPGGSNPAYNDIKRQTVAYEVMRGGVRQIGYRDLGRPEQIISANGGELGNGDSTDPVIGNSGFYVTFESAASNLGVRDGNGERDVYLYTDVRRLRLLESLDNDGSPLPGGGFRPSMSFYANYILFESPVPLGSNQGPRQVFMRWLGGV